MSEYNFSFDWARVTTLGKVKILVEQVVGAPSQAQIDAAVAQYIEDHPGALSPLSAATKAALLQIAEKVAYIDEHGEDYYNALDAALSARALLQITAVYTQSGTVYDTDSLDSLKADLVVTAYYDDGTTADVTSACTLSGTLEEGTSTITATYSGKSATFAVTVTEYPRIFVYRGKGTSGASISDNAKRALTGMMPFTNTAPITVRWEGCTESGATFGFKNCTSDTTIDSTGTGFSVSPASIGDTTTYSGAWAAGNVSLDLVKSTSGKVSGFTTYSQTNGYCRLLIANTDTSADLPATLAGYITISGVRYLIEEKPASEFE